MESLLVLIMAMSLMQLVVQISLARKSWQKWSLIVLIGAFSFASYPYAIQQSYTSIQQLISNQNTLVDLSVLQIMEAILGILLVIIILKKAIGEKVNSRIVNLKYIPGIICLPALFYSQSYLFLHIPNSSFMLLALGIALGLILTLSALVFGFNVLIDEYELRCEIKLLLHIAQIISAVILYLFTTGLPINQSTQNTSLSQFLTLLAGILGVALVGYLLYPLKIKRLLTLKNK